MVSVPKGYLGGHWLFLIWVKIKMQNTYPRILVLNNECLKVGETALQSVDVQRAAAVTHDPHSVRSKASSRRDPR